MTTLRFAPYEIMAAELGAENPMPDLKNVSYIHATYRVSDNLSEEDKKHMGKGMVQTILPYLNEDGYNRDLKKRAFRAAILENEKMRAVFYQCCLVRAGGKMRQAHIDTTFRFAGREQSSRLTDPLHKSALYECLLI